MTYYPDLSRCDYFGAIDLPLVAIGWLENGRPVPTGEVPEQVFEQLRELLREPWGPVVFAGWHDCDLCVYRYGPSKMRTNPSTVGFKNVFVPGGGKIYVAPELILHYIDQHVMGPPQSSSRRCWTARRCDRSRICRPSSTLASHTSR
jgi:hypothetical protein